jgi:hypothetical protein
VPPKAFWIAEIIGATNGVVQQIQTDASSDTSENEPICYHRNACRQRKLQ